MNSGWKTCVKMMSKFFKLFFLLLSISLNSTFAKSDSEEPKFRRYEDIDRKFNMEVSKKRKQEIEYLKKVIRNTRFGKKNKEPFIMRLAELYWEQAKFEFDLEIAEANQRHDIWLKNGKKGPAPRPRHITSRNYYNRSIATVRQVIKKDTKPVYKVKALYFLGFNLIEIGKGMEGAKFLKQLLSEFKKDPRYSSQAAAKLADYYFDSDQPLNALTYYNQLLKIKDVALQTYVRYKIAWCYMKLGWGEKTMKGFEDARSYIKRNQNVKKSIGLLNEVEKDHVKAVAVFKKPHEAKPYLLKHYGRADLRNRLDYLASLYLVRKMRHAAITMYKNIIALDTMSIENIDIEIKIFDLYKEPFNLKMVREHILHLSNNYGIDSHWYQRHGKNSKVLAKIEEMMRVSTTRTHEIIRKRIQKKENKLPLKLAYREALDMYSSYLKEFPQSEHAYHMRFVYSQLLFDLKMWRQASEQYEKLYQLDPDGKFAKIVVLNTVVCFDNLRPSKIPKFKDIAKKNLAEDEKSFIAASDRYIKKFPEDKRTCDDLKYKTAEIYKSYNHFDEALRIYKLLVFHSEFNDLKESSAYRVLEIYDTQKDLKSLSYFCSEVISHHKLGGLANKLKLKSIQEKAEIQYAAELEKDGNLNAAALQYFHFYKNFPQSKQSGKALYNSLVLYRKSGDVDRVKELNLIILKSHPKDEIAISSYQEIAQNHYESGEYSEAVEFYMKLYDSRLLKDQKALLSLINNSANISLMLKDYILAEKYYNEIVRKFPGTPEANQALLAQAQIQEFKNNYRSAISAYEVYFKRVELAPDELAYYYSRFANWSKNILKNDQQAMSYYNKIIKLPLNNLKTGVEYYAEAKFYIIEGSFKKYLNINDTAKAQQTMQALMKNYAEIVKIGNSKYTIGTLVRLGQIFEHFSKVVKNAPLPSEEELGGASVDDYKAEVQKIINQHIDEAKASYVNAIENAQKGRVLTEFIFEARTNLEMLEKRNPTTKCFWEIPGYILITDNTKNELYYEKF